MPLSSWHKCFLNHSSSIRILVILVCGLYIFQPSQGKRKSWLANQKPFLYQCRIDIPSPLLLDLSPAISLVYLMVLVFYSFHHILAFLSITPADFPLHLSIRPTQKVFNWSFILAVLSFVIPLLSFNKYIFINISFFIMLVLSLIILINYLWPCPT